MKFCTVCEKERETHIRVTKPKWYFLHKYKSLHDREFNDSLTYEREVCIKCQSELLIDKKPEFDIKIKSDRKNRRRSIYVNSAWN